MVDKFLIAPRRFVPLQIMDDYLMSLVISQVPHEWAFFYFKVDRLDLLGLLDNHRSALHGHLRQPPAPCSTWRRTNPLLSAHSLPTLYYFSLWALACSACTLKQTVCPLGDASCGSRCAVAVLFSPNLLIEYLFKGSHLALCCNARRSSSHGTSGCYFLRPSSSDRYFATGVHVLEFELWISILSDPLSSANWILFR